MPVSDLGAVRRPEAPDRLATWEDWATISKLCGNHPRLTVTLDMTYFVHSPQLLGRWIAEPVANVYIPASSFISNAKQYPVLSKSCQEFLRGLLKVLRFEVLDRLRLTRDAVRADNDLGRNSQRAAHLGRRERLRAIVRPFASADEATS